MSKAARFRRNTKKVSRIEMEGACLEEEGPKPGGAFRKKEGGERRMNDAGAEGKV